MKKAYKRVMDECKCKRMQKLGKNKIDYLKRRTTRGIFPFVAKNKLK
jgi:hypothetical protein